MTLRGSRRLLLGNIFFWLRLFFGAHSGGIKEKSLDLTSIFCVFIRPMDRRTKISEAVEVEQPIKFRLYALLQESEDDINFIATEILNKFRKPELLPPVYTAIKELALNGAKANIKRVLFKEMDVDESNPESYEQAMVTFKEKLTESFIKEYAIKAKEMGLFVDIKFDYNKHRLIIEVENNSALSEKEDKRIRGKFAKGSTYDNIAEFYMDTMDNSEGAGLGITLILMLIKAEGIDPHVFTIKSDFEEKTVAKLEFPLSSTYKTSRERFAQVR